MKKLLLLLGLPLFVACSNSDDDKTVYLDNKLIEGSWYWIDQTDSIVEQFKNNGNGRFIYDKYTKDLRQKFYNGDYKLTDTDIVYLKEGKVFGSRQYKLKDDTLSMLNSINGIWIKYKKVK